MDSGSTGSVDADQMSYSEYPDYVPLVRRAFELCDELEEDSQQHGWEQHVLYIGGLYAGPRGCTAVEELRTSAVEEGLDHEVLSG
ncbi:hypothetical protein [uncultured Corynebacterium sp.]|uniref:hypothetical protein n=1 Tax=uncultured Corynebacterium sp. TaxID=159447 RepID=UPI0025FA8F2C|nr:hypothetical protein [uncultured Corynebacterium sp.]